MWYVYSQQKIKYIYLQETSSTNTSDRGGHLWPGHQILRDKSSVKGENAASSRSGSNTDNIISNSETQRAVQNAKWLIN